MKVETKLCQPARRSQLWTGRNANLGTASNLAIVVSTSNIGDYKISVTKHFVFLLVSQVKVTFFSM